jgi:hypothetical protein
MNAICTDQFMDQIILEPIALYRVSTHSSHVDAILVINDGAKRREVEKSNRRGHEI